MDEFKIDGYEFEFRIKKMNALEVVALKSVISFSSLKKSEETCRAILERLEVKIKDKWFPVKTPNEDSFLPSVLEDDPNLLNELVNHFMYNFIKPIFFK